MGRERCAELTLAVGLGGVVVLWLAVRRQRSIELDLLQKYETHQLAEHIARTNEAHQLQVAADAREDATERRITELYTKAVEMIGSEKAPVRLAADGEVAGTPNHETLVRSVRWPGLTNDP